MERWLIGVVDNLLLRLLILVVEVLAQKKQKKERAKIIILEVDRISNLIKRRLAVEDDQVHHQALTLANHQAKGRKRLIILLAMLRIRSRKKDQVLHLAQIQVQVQAVVQIKRRKNRLQPKKLHNPRKQLRLPPKKR